MAKSDNLADYLVDIADAIRTKKGTTEPINAQDFASEIASIESGGNSSMIRVPYLRRVGAGYIDTGVDGANSNLRIIMRYAFRVFHTTYWKLLYAYVNESTNATRILISKNATVLANINSLASGSVTKSETLYKDVVYTTEIYSTASDICLEHDGIVSKKTRSEGAELNGVNIHIFSNLEDDVDIELYSTEMYDGDTLIRDYVPHYYNGEFGLYDLVEKKFYRNAGGGTFTGELEYVKSDGYIPEVDDLLSNNLTTLRSNATSIRAYALRGLSKLTSVDLPNVKTVGDNGFYGVGCVELSLPSCTKIGDTCIAYCTSLTKVNLPKCTTLGTYAFRDNKLLSEVSLPACTTLAQNAFYNCDSLAKISLPSVTAINASAFSGSAIFATLILGGSSVVQLVNTNAFTGTKIASGTGYIYVPSALVEDYKVASNWSNYAEQIRAIEDYPEITA